MARQSWTRTEETLLKEKYPTATKEELLLLFSNRTWESLKRKATKLGIIRRGVWTEQELKTVRYYSEWSKERLLKALPNRSWLAIKTMANILGKKRRTFKWTDREKRRLKRMYFSSSKQELLRMFPDTTWNTIQTKACELGLTGKRKDWTEQEIEVLKNNYSSCTREEIQEMLPQRSWSAILRKAHKCDLKINKKKNGPGARWSQHKALDIVDNILGEKAVRDQKYDWMKSPKGRPLEIDGYYPKHNLAVEYQGQHHFDENCFLGHNDLNYQQQCDKIKKQAISNRGIRFLEIKYDEPLIRQYLSDRVVQIFK